MLTCKQIPHPPEKYTYVLFYSTGTPRSILQIYRDSLPTVVWQGYVRQVDLARPQVKRAKAEFKRDTRLDQRIQGDVHWSFDALRIMTMCADANNGCVQMQTTDMCTIEKVTERLFFHKKCTLFTEPIQNIGPKTI